MVDKRIKKEPGNGAVVNYHNDLTALVHHHLYYRFYFFLNCCVSGKLMRDIIKMGNSNYELSFTSATHQMGTGCRRTDINHYSSTNHRDTKENIDPDVLNQKPSQARDQDAAHTSGIGLSPADFQKAKAGIRPVPVQLLEKIYHSLEGYLGHTHLVPTFINQSAFLDRKIDKIQIEKINEYIKNTESKFSNDEIMKLADSYHTMIYNSQDEKYTGLKNLDKKIGSLVSQ